MPTLFTQNTFLGGLNAQFARVNTPAGAYPLLFNGRTNRGTIAPVRRHQQDTTLPSGTYQAIVAIGDYVLVVISGVPYWKNVATGGGWNEVAGFTPLLATAEEVYAVLMPTGTNRLLYSESDVPTYGAAVANTPQCLLLADGVTQPQLIFPDGSTRPAFEYTDWTPNRPEYVPVGHFPVVSGVKSYMASRDKTVIYQSRSGRPLDYVVVTDEDGRADGNADALVTAVDYNALTSIQASANGGIIATTLGATYAIEPSDTDTLFGEPILQSRLLFPVGCVNWKSSVDILGDSAFISQSGIQSFNTVLQTQRESNNYPLGARIARYLVNPQSATAAINYDTYALFAVNTVYGEVVAVFDTTTQQFVSFDTGFGKVRQFAVHRSGSEVRLWFINTDNELYEAYASEEFATTTVLLGDYSVVDPEVRDHTVSEVFASFVNLTSAVDVRMALYADERTVLDSQWTIGSDDLLEPPAPGPLPPFTDQQRATNIVASAVAKKQAKATSLWLQWRGGAELAAVSLEGTVAKPGQQSRGEATAAEETVHVLLGNLDLSQSQQTVAAFAVATVAEGEIYFADGSVNTGLATVTDATFVSPGDVVRVDGRISLVTNEVTLRQTLRTLAPAEIISLGDVCYPAGTEADYQRMTAFFGTSPGPLYGLSGSIERLTSSGLAWFQRNQRYYPVTTTHVDYFLFNAYDIDGVAVASTQGQAFRAALAASTARYKVAVVNKPLYSDTAVGDDTTIQWLLEYVDAVICGGVCRYERFYVKGKSVINASCAGGAVAALDREQTSVFTTETAGYLMVKATALALNLSYNDINGTLLDATAIA